MCHLLLFCWVNLIIFTYFTINQFHSQLCNSVKGVEGFLLASFCWTSHLLFCGDPQWVALGKMQVKNLPCHNAQVLTQGVMTSWEWQLIFISFKYFTKTAHISYSMYSSTWPRPEQSPSLQQHLAFRLLKTPNSDPTQNHFWKIKTPWGGGVWQGFF